MRVRQHKIHEREDIRTFARVTSNRFYEDWLPRIREMFEKSLLVHWDKYPSLNLQIELLGHILSTDRARRKYKRFKELTGRALQSLVKTNAPKERIRLAQSRFDNLAAYEAATQWVLSRLRAIGDGVAWRFLDYDRAVLRLLAEHEPISPPQLDKGLEAELDTLLRLARDEGRPVLLNSIANFLRVGDLTTVDPTTHNVTLVEVKAGKSTNARTLRQGAYLTIVQEGLGKGLHSLAGTKLRKIIADKPMNTYVPSVERAIDEAKKRFSSSRLFGDYLSVGVYATRKILDELPEGKWPAIWASVLDRLYAVQRRKSDLLLPVMSSLFPLANFSPNLAPYVIFPMDPNYRFALVTGEVWILSVLNVSGLARWLEKRGWKSKVIPPPSVLPQRVGLVDIPVIQVFRDGRGTELGLVPLVIAAMEFWMPETIETSIECITTLGDTCPESGQAYQVSFPNSGKYAWD